MRTLYAKNNLVIVKKKVKKLESNVIKYCIHIKRLPRNDFHGIMGENKQIERYIQVLFMLLCHHKFGIFFALKSTGIIL